MSDQRPLPSDGPDEEQSAGARPAGPATTRDGGEVVRDSRPWVAIGVILLVIFLAIVAYAIIAAPAR
jgi:hypothetical protein